jgi:hypothetical protein
MQPARAAEAPEPGTPALWQEQPASLLPSRLPVTGRESWQVDASASDFEAADATAVRQVTGSWSVYAPRDGTNDAFRSARADLAVSRDAWEVAATARFDILIDGPRSTWDAVHAYNQRSVVPDGSTFAIDAHEKGVIWAGLRAAHTWVLRPGTDNGLELTTAFTLLSLERVQDFDATGSIDYAAASGYGFAVDARRQDSHKQYGGYGDHRPIGNGWTGDLGLLWLPTEKTFVSLSAVDLLSSLRIRGVSTQQATLSSSTNSVDADGYLAYQPLAHGRYSSQDLQPRLDTNWSASAGVATSVAGHDLLVGGRFEHVGDIDLPALWATVPLTPDVALQVDGEFRFQSLGLGLQTKYGGFMLRSRSLDVGDSRTLGWQATLRLPF